MSYLTSLYNNLSRFISPQQLQHASNEKNSDTATALKSLDAQGKNLFKLPVELWNSYSTEANEDLKPNPLLIYALKVCPQTADEAIDLGCGIGADTMELLKRGWKVTAIDSNAVALKLLKENINKHQLNKESKSTTHLGAIEDCDLKQKCHLINAINVLGFCDPKKVMKLWKKMYDCLSTGDTLVCTMPLFKCPSLFDPDFTSWRLSYPDMKALFVDKQYTIKVESIEPLESHPIFWILQKV